MKQTILIFIILVSTVFMGCGDKKKNNHNNNYNDNGAICDRVRRSGNYWRDPQTEIKYRREGHYLEERYNENVRIYCSTRFDGKNDQCENTYYSNNDFYDNDSDERVDDCHIKDYYFVRNGNHCPYGYSSYRDVRYVNGRAQYEFFCLNNYMFYNQWGYHSSWGSSESSLPLWLTAGFLIGLAL